MTIYLMLLAALAGLAVMPTVGSLVAPDADLRIPVLPRRNPTIVGSRSLAIAIVVVLLLATAGMAIQIERVTAGGPVAASAYRADTPRAGSLPGEMANVATMVGATAAWSQGLDGSGVGIALIDSGITPTAGLDAPGAIVNGPDFTVDAGTPAAHLDAAGHGTHLAGIIAARPEAASGALGDYTGIAPGAHLVNLKARAADGSTDVAAVTAAVRWAVDHRFEHNIRVLNLAFNTTGPSAALTQALDDAWDAGITVVVSAGNGGVDDTTLAAPAGDARLLSVGGTDPMGTASTLDDRLGEFSSRGNATLEPSLVAPGRSIVSAAAPGSEAAAVDAAQVAPGLMKGTGTSQASAVVSGAAALLLEQRPGLTPDQVKSSLLASAAPLGDDAIGQGAGMLDVARALKSPVPVVGSDHRSPASNGGLGLRRGPAAWGSNSWGSNSWGSNSWGSNSWGSNSWGSNSWGSNSWGSNSWGSNSWGSNSWGSNSWGSNSWGSNSWGSNSWGSNSWGSNSWGSNSWGSNSWGSNSWGSNSWGSNSWGSNSWGSNSWGSNSWGSNSWGSNSWGSNSWGSNSWGSNSWGSNSWG